MANAKAELPTEAETRLQGRVNVVALGDSVWTATSPDHPSRELTITREGRFYNGQFRGGPSGTLHNSPSWQFLIRLAFGAPTK